MKPEADTLSLLSALAAQIRRQASVDGENRTVVPGLVLMRFSAPTLVQRGVLRPSFCVVAQGDKIAQAGEHTTLRYGAGNFLASSIDMPIAGQVLHASKAKPYLAAVFELSPHDVLSVLTDAKIQVERGAPSSPVRSSVRPTRGCSTWSRARWLRSPTSARRASSRRFCAKSSSIVS